jgi:hypothetical protein
VRQPKDWDDGGSSSFDLNTDASSDGNEGKDDGIEKPGDPVTH